MRKWVVKLWVVISAALVSTLLYAGFLRLTEPPLVIHDELKFSNSVDISANEPSLDELAIDHTIADDFGFRPRRPEPEEEIIIVENPHEKYPIGKNELSLPELGEVTVKLLPENDVTCPHCGTPKYMKKPNWNAETSGSCKFELSIGADGIPIEILDLNCSNPYFERIVGEALPKWIYYPKVEDGKSVEFTASSKLSFRLTDEDGEIVPE